jgi:hypothetical protein
MSEYTSLSELYKDITDKHALTFKAVYLNFADHSASSHKKRDVSEMGSVSVFSWR